MTLVPGTRLGAYELIAPIGVGGMGEVYQATDTNLKRRVAIKVLPPSVATDSDRLTRFRREAQVLASLNHPHIAQIYGLEEATGTPFLVLELVDGEGLDNRIARGPIRADEALGIATQIAEALEAAHEAGIVHRDLKPANIRVSPDDTVKVLDFGLAKALGPKVPLSNDAGPTLTSPAMTQIGIILGTAAYMSPEQAKGRPVDRRADVWAFGAVLYEMITGSRAFTGDSVTEAIASVLARDPDWSKLPADASAIAGVIRRCLERDPRQRFGDMQSVRVALTDALAVGLATAAVTVNGAPANREVTRARSTAIAWGVALAATVAAGALSTAYVTRRSADQPVVKSSILPPPNVAFDFDITVGPAVISPNGRLIAFSGRDATNHIQLWVRPIDATDARPIAGTDGASFPFWSPDSQALGFYSAARGQLERVDLVGGAPVVIARAGYVRGACWTPDGAVLYDTNDGNGQIMEVAIGGGAPKSLIRDNGNSRSPWLLPDGRHFLYSHHGKREIHVASRDGITDKVLTNAISNAVYADGHLIFMRENTLLAQPFDLASLALTGSATAIARDVQMLTGDSRGVFSASDTGTLLYLDGAGASSTTLAWFDGNGRRVGTVGEIGGARGVRLSPDGRIAALTLIDPEGRQTIWTLDLATKTRKQLTFAQDPAAAYVSWSPDGRTLAYGATRDTRLVIAQRPAGGGVEQVVYTLTLDQSRIGNPRVSAWTNDGATILYSGSGAGGIWSLALAPGLSGERSPQILVRNPSTAQNVRLAPNQRWFSYQGALDGGPTPQIFVEAFPGGGRRQQVSAGGTIALWGADNKSLYYADDNVLTVLSVTEADGALHFGPPRAIMPIIVGRGYSYDVAKDGRILALVTSEAAGIHPLTLVQNWAKATGSR